MQNKNTNKNTIKDSKKVPRPTEPKVQNPGKIVLEELTFEDRPIGISETLANKLKKQQQAEPDDSVPCLYTPTDVRNTREKMLKEQKGIDPVLKQPLKLTDAVLDHDHQSQHCRAVLHRQTNAFEGLVFNAYRRCLEWSSSIPLPQVLRGLADYLEQDYTANPYHPGWIKRVETDFKALNANRQRHVLARMNASTEGANASARVAAFKSAVLLREFRYAKIRHFILMSKAEA